MRRNFSFFCFMLLLTVSCSSSQQTTTLSFQDYRIEKKQAIDSSMLKMLQPYSKTLDESMNTVIGFSKTHMQEKQPERGLVNFMAYQINFMA